MPPEDGRGNIAIRTTHYLKLMGAIIALGTAIFGGFVGFSSAVYSRGQESARRQLESDQVRNQVTMLSASIDKLATVVTNNSLRLSQLEWAAAFAKLKQTAAPKDTTD